MRPFDDQGRFAPSVPGGGNALRRLAVRSAGMTIFSGAMGVAIQIVSAVVLSRLLTPRDFGLVTMVTTFSLLLMNAAANGFTDLVVQRKEMTQALASTLFWINLGIALLLSAAFAVSGPLLARFYHEALVGPITAGLSVVVLITCLPTLHVALLKRAMRFTAIAKNDILARAIGVLTAIAFALAGWSYWSLVMGAGALALSTAVGALILCPWVPERPSRMSGVRGALHFSGHISGRFSINYFARNSDNLLVGWRFGAHALGFYKKAYDLFALSASQLVAATSNVAVSALSRVREDREQYRRYLFGSIAVMSLIGMGLGGDLTLVGKDLIRVLLGPGWETAGVIFTYFAPGIGMMIIYYIHGWIHVSMGRADRWFRWGIVEWSVTFSLFLLGLHWGPEGIAMAWCVSFWILTVPAMSYAGKPIGVRGRDVMAIVWRYVLASALAGATIYATVLRIDFVRRLNGSGGSALRLTIASSGFVCLYLVLIVILHGGTKPLQRILKLLRELTSRRRPQEIPVENAIGEMKA